MEKSRVVYWENLFSYLTWMFITWDCSASAGLSLPWRGKIFITYYSKKISFLACLFILSARVYVAPKELTLLPKTCPIFCVPFLNFLLLDSKGGVDTQEVLVENKLSFVVHLPITCSTLKAPSKYLPIYLNTHCILPSLIPPFSSPSPPPPHKHIFYSSLQVNVWFKSMVICLMLLLTRQYGAKI